MADDTKRLNIVVSADLHKELKVEVAKTGTTIGQFVAEAIAEKIAKDYSAVFVRFGDALDAYIAKYPIKQIIWDGVHPTYVGHGILARCWLETVEKAYNKSI